MGWGGGGVGHNVIQVECMTVIEFKILIIYRRMCQSPGLIQLLFTINMLLNLMSEFLFTGNSLLANMLLSLVIFHR